MSDNGSKQRIQKASGGAANANDEQDRPNLTDRGNAIRMVQDFGSNLRYCVPWRKWTLWDGQRWRIDDTLAVVRCAKKTISKLFKWTLRKMKELAEPLEAEENNDSNIE